MKNGGRALARVRSSPQLAIAAIAQDMRNIVAGENGACNLPVISRQARAEQKRAIVRPREQKYVVCRWISQSPPPWFRMQQPDITRGCTYTL